MVADYLRRSGDIDAHWLKSVKDYIYSVGFVKLSLSQQTWQMQMEQLGSAPVNSLTRTRRASTRRNMEEKLCQNTMKY